MPASRAPARDLRHDAAGGERDAPLRHGEAVAIGGDGHGIAHVVEIVERLAHAHQHDVGDLALGVGDQAAVGGRRSAGPVADAVARQQDLADDLLGLEVAHQTLRAGVAERAGERAADLARDAQRAAIVLGDVDRLDLGRARLVAALGKTQEPFARAVGGDLLGGDLGAGEGVGVARAWRAGPWRRRTSGRRMWRRGHRSSSRAGRPACGPASRARRRRRAQPPAPRGRDRRARAWSAALAAAGECRGWCSWGRTD